jgi:hypothetical protein
MTKKFVLLLFCALLSLTAVAQTITTNQTGTHDGYFYSFWNAGGGSVTMTLGSGGNYSVTWSNCNNFTCGKGWNPGSIQNVSFSGSFDGGSNGYLALYGWTKNALIEYYVVENYGSWTPPGGSSLGTMSSDGGTYNIYKMHRDNAPSIIGTASFDQYWSVRTSKRSSGTVTFSNHVSAWSSHGMSLGSTWDYQIMETEGYQSSGSANITVSSGGSSPTSAPTSAPTATPTNPPACSLKGDVNGTGSVDVVDALLIAQYSVGLNPSGFNSACADTNCSGSIDIVDALLIAQKYVGLISTFPC